MAINFVLSAAKKIPREIRELILEKELIEKARNVFETNTPMEVLFDAYEEYVDLSGEFDDFSCWKCRDHVLNQFYKMKVIFIKMKEANV